ncbi:MAG: endonuclease/exonuclease/phosphatase family protein, partial [Candidatus Micrarchaeaceae archaeon]
MYWNIWLDNQLPSKQQSGRFLNSLKTIIDEFNPDCFGLNEVTAKTCTSDSTVLRCLSESGYRYINYAPSERWDDTWDIGDAIVSRYPIIASHLVPLSADVERGDQPMAIFAHVALPGNTILKIGVVHLRRLE